jgi:hypothetical protein
VNKLTVMVEKGSRRVNMIGRVSPKHNRFLPITTAIKKKSVSSPKGMILLVLISAHCPFLLFPHLAYPLFYVGKTRASSNPDLEKSHVEILLEHKDTGAWGDNGCWSSKEWTKMIQEFHTWNRYVNFNRNQIQEKEGQLKRDYNMLKEARKQSGSSWNERRCMVAGPSSMWENLEVVS